MYLTNLGVCVFFVHVECDPPDVIPDIKIPISMSRLVGTRRTVECTTQPFPSRQRITCNTDGQWVRQYDSCSKYRLKHFHKIWFFNFFFLLNFTWGSVAKIVVANVHVTH